jgi:hypothetical protein
MILLVGGRRIIASYDFVTYMIIDCKIWHWLLWGHFLQRPVGFSTPPSARPPRCPFSIDCSEGEEMFRKGLGGLRRNLSTRQCNEVPNKTLSLSLCARIFNRALP